MPAREARRHYASGHWTSETLLDIVVARAESAPDRSALIDDRGRLTNAQALDGVTGVASTLSERGVHGGAPVIVQLPNGSVFAMTNVAISALGAVIVPINHSMRAAEVLAVARRVGAAIVVIGAGRDAHAAELGADGLDVVVDDDLWSAAVAPGDRPWSPHLSEADADDILDLMFTSGTTGTPKGIVNTTNTKFSALRAMVGELGLGPDDTWLVVPPMAHNAGWLYSLLPAIASGATAVFQDRFDPRVTLDLIDQHGVRAVFLTPTHANDVLACVDAGRRAPTTLRQIVIGGASTSVQMKARMRQQLGAEVISMYGCTENQGVTFVRPGGRPEDVDDTVGRACPGAEVAIFSEDRTTRLGAGETGLVATRGAGTFVGYFDDQAATDAAFNVGGWFFAGDLGRLDEAGALRLTGRQKELIIRGGLNIVPDDVEVALVDHPRIEAVAAVGIPDERLGEKVCVVVIGDASLDLEAVVGHLRSRGVGTHVWPEALMVVEEFPRTDIGKVKRGELRLRAIEALARGELVTGS